MLFVFVECKTRMYNTLGINVFVATVLQKELFYPSAYLIICKYEHRSVKIKHFKVKNREMIWTIEGVQPDTQTSSTKMDYLHGLQNHSVTVSVTENECLRVCVHCNCTIRSIVI